MDLPGRSARLRIFTEDEELDFAGHPVLGAAAVLHTLLPTADVEENWAVAVAQRTVEARTRGADRWVDATMDQGVPILGPAITGELAEAYRDALNLAGPAAGYLLHHGVRPAREPILVHQGRFTGRPSTIEVRPGPDGRLWVGGPVAPVAAGRFHADLT